MEDSCLFGSSISSSSGSFVASSSTRLRLLRGRLGSLLLCLASLSSLHAFVPIGPKCQAILRKRLFLHEHVGDALSPYRYHIVECVPIDRSIIVKNRSVTVEVCGDENESASALFSAWMHRYPTRSQFRKACRQRELILLIPRQGYLGKPTDGDDVGASAAADRDFFRDNGGGEALSEDRPVALEWADEASQLVLARYHAVWLCLSTRLPNVEAEHYGNERAPPLQVARISRASCSPGYPPKVTGFITPPDVVVSGKFTHTHVVYQDDHLAVVDKPEGLVTIGCPRQDLQSAVPFVLTPPPESSTASSHAYTPRPVHRLDKATRGLVLVAKDSISLRRLSDALAQGCVRKTYTALVHGRVQKETDLRLVWEDGKDSTNDKMYVLDDPIDGRPSVSTYRVLSSSKRLSLVQVCPHTGRFHQVRRHLHYSLGHTVVGDAKYSRPSSSQSESRPDLHDGLFLCANRLVFTHPITQQLMDVSIDLPEKFERALEQDNAATDAPRRDFESLSPSFQRYVSAIRKQYGADFTTSDDDGVACTGEPAVDPSRLVRPNQGDSEWIDDW